MIYMAFALYWEARPWIEYLGLKKNDSFEKFQVFESSSHDGADKEFILFITGAGSVNAAAAVAYICAKRPPSSADLFVNIGVAAGKLSMRQGSIYRVHSIYELATRRWFYPDMQLGFHGIAEASLATSPAVVEKMEDFPCELADMEAAALYQSAQMFFCQHQLLFFKVVYDRPDEQRGVPVADEVYQLCRQWTETVCAWLCAAFEQLSHRAERAAVSFSDQEQAACEAFAGWLKATAAMKLKLYQLLYYKKLEGGDLMDFLKAFRENGAPKKCHSKKEGMEQLNRLRESLWI